MNSEEKRKMQITCEICKIAPATNIKGGVYNGICEMFMCCKECISKIKDRRLK